jgi:deoxyribonuclease V
MPLWSKMSALPNRQFTAEIQTMIQHAWDVTPTQARAIQVQLRDAVILQDQLGAVQRVAGIDVGFEASNTITRAAVVVLGFPELELLEQTVARRPTAFPYIPGLLSFREVPAVLDALQQLRLTPDLLCCCATARASRIRGAWASPVTWAC